MADDSRPEPESQIDRVEGPALTEDQRREFLAKAAKLAATGPMVALLLGTPTDQAHAQFGSGPVPSDRRLKTDIERIGTLQSGIGVYSYRYRWDSTRQVGVMADEVEAVVPAAVTTDASGYKFVDYGVLLA